MEGRTNTQPESLRIPALYPLPRSQGAYGENTKKEQPKKTNYRNEHGKLSC